MMYLKQSLKGLIFLVQKMGKRNQMKMPQRIIHCTEPFMLETLVMR
jgi:hypothetical protein